MKKEIRFRLGFIFACFLMFYGFIFLRLAHLQVVKNPALENLAQKQFVKTSKKTPYRLAIHDRNGEELAVSIPSSSLFARPKFIRARRKTAQVLSKYLGGTPQKWLKKLDLRKPFVWIQRQITEDLAQKLNHQGLAGVFIEAENHRIYPGDNLASQVLGFTDIDGTGISGIELSLNQELLEAGSKMSLSRDGKGNPSYIDKKYSQAEQNREGVYLTLDRRIQNILEEELTLAYEETKANGVFAVVMDPNTGEIFGMGQRPTYDPNHLNQSTASNHTNRVISHLYEPGSTMKILLMGEALEAGVLKKNSHIECNQGKYKIGDVTIHEAEESHKFGALSLEEIIQHSSNIGAAKVALKLGKIKVKEAIEKFGLTQKSGILLPGEVTSTLRSDDQWGQVYLATVGFGQGISTTPLQMLMAYSAIANGGYLIKPKILLQDVKLSQERKRVFSKETVQELNKYLIAAVAGKKATGSLAQISGIPVAGKTGTAQKFDGEKGYDSKKYYSSFIGYLPADKPELIVAVMVDEPKNNYYGSKVAAPYFKKIAERSLQILGRNPKQKLMANNNSESKRSDTKIVTKAIQLSKNDVGSYVMPELKGLSMREVLNILGNQFDKVRITGTGYLEAQAPEPGVAITSETPIQLGFHPEES